MKLSVHRSFSLFHLSLHVAATQGLAECLGVILAHGADVSLPDASGLLEQQQFGKHIVLHYVSDLK